MFGPSVCGAVFRCSDSHEGRRRLHRHRCAVASVCIRSRCHAIVISGERHVASVQICAVHHSRCRTGGRAPRTLCVAARCAALQLSRRPVATQDALMQHKSMQMPRCNAVHTAQADECPRPHRRRSAAAPPHAAPPHAAQPRRPPRPQRLARILRARRRRARRRRGRFARRRAPQH